MADLTVGCNNTGKTVGGGAVMGSAKGETPQTIEWNMKNKNLKT